MRRRGSGEQETWRPKNEWFCLSCNEQEGRSHNSMMKHLRGAHGLPEPIRGDRRMALHLDAEDYYVSSYDWTIAGQIKARQQVVGPR